MEEAGRRTDGQKHGLVEKDRRPSYARSAAAAAGEPEWRNGRRDGLKIRCPQGRVGSSPSSGTLENWGLQSGGPSRSPPERGRFFARSTEHRNNTRENSFESTGCQLPRLHPNQSLVSREEFSGPGKAGYTKPTVGKIIRRDRDRAVVTIRITGYLAENPISPTNACQDDCRAEFCLR